MLKDLIETIWKFLKKILEPYKPQILALWEDIQPHVPYLIEFHDFLIFYSRYMMVFIILWYLIHKYFLGWRFYTLLVCWGTYAISVYNQGLLVQLYDGWFAQIANTFAVWFITALPGADRVSPDQKLCIHCLDYRGHTWPLKFVRLCPNGGWLYPPIYSTIYFTCAVLKKWWIKYYVLGGGLAEIFNDISWIASLFYLT